MLLGYDTLMTASTDTTAAKEDYAMARSEVKDNVKDAGAVLGQSGRELAATARRTSVVVPDREMATTRS